MISCEIINDDDVISCEIIMFFTRHSLSCFLIQTIANVQFYYVSMAIVVLAVSHGTSHPSSNLFNKTSVYLTNALQSILHFFGKERMAIALFLVTQTLDF